MALRLALALCSGILASVHGGLLPEDTCPLASKLEPDSVPVTGVCSSYENLNCCTDVDSETVKIQVGDMGLLRSLFTSNQEQCLAVVEELFCGFACSPHQADFVRVEPLITSVEGFFRAEKHTLAPVDGTKSNNFTVYLCEDFCYDLYEACRDTTTSIGQTVSQWMSRDKFCTYFGTAPALIFSDVTISPPGCESNSANAPCAPYVNLEILRLDQVGGSRGCFSLPDGHPSKTFDPDAGSQPSPALEPDSMAPETPAPTDSTSAAASVSVPLLLGALGVLAVTPLV